MVRDVFFRSICASFCLEAQSIDVLLGRLTTISFLSHQFETPLTVSFNFLSTNGSLVPVAVAVISSASSSNDSGFGRYRGRSLMYISLGKVGDLELIPGVHLMLLIGGQSKYFG